jgi:GAF domain-containing protein
VLGADDVRDLTGRTGGSPFLHSDARSALALPLIARGSVFGAISVQSGEPAAFHGGDVVSLRIIADQLSSAISNAQLAQELRECLEQLETLQHYYVRETWERFLAESTSSTYEYHRPEIEPLGDGPLPELERVLADPRLAMLGGDDASSLLVPIPLREHVLGVLGLHRLDADQPWTEEQVDLLAAVSEQMGLIIENSRLFSEARSRAARERRARQIVARLRQSLDIEEVLATAVQELGDALQLHEVTIRLAGTEEPIGE